MNPQLLQAIQTLLASVNALTRQIDDDRRDRQTNTTWANAKQKSFLGGIGRSFLGNGKSAQRNVLEGHKRLGIGAIKRGFSRLRGGRQFAKRLGFGRAGQVVAGDFPSSRAAPAMAILQAQSGLQDWLRAQRKSRALEENEVERQLSNGWLTRIALAGLTDLSTSGKNPSALSNSSILARMSSHGLWQSFVGHAARSVGIDRPPSLSHETVVGPQPVELSTTANDVNFQIKKPRESEPEQGQMKEPADNGEVYWKWIEQAQDIGNERIRQADERIKRMRDSGIKRK